MKKERFKIIGLLFVFTLQYCESTVYAKTNLDDSVLVSNIAEMLDTFERNTSHLSSAEKNVTLDSIAALYISKNDTSALIEVLIKKIDLGERSVLLLEDFAGRSLRLSSPLLYNKLENHLNKSFIQYCLEFYPNINFELTFLYRHLFRMDQRYKLLAQDFPDSKVILDSLRHLSEKQDSLTEAVLGNLFYTHGIPTFEDVGPESNNLMIFLAHVSPDFVIRHIGKIQTMMLNNELISTIQSFEFVIDKALHKKYGITIYNTVWNKHSPKINDDKELKRIKTTMNII
jgi:hypothetical protein